MLRESALFVPEWTIFLMMTEELRELFGKIIQTFTEIQLSNDWKAGQEDTFPGNLNLTLMTAL